MHKYVDGDACEDETWKSLEIRRNMGVISLICVFLKEWQEYDSKRQNLLNFSRLIFDLVDFC